MDNDKYNLLIVICPFSSLSNILFIYIKLRGTTTTTTTDSDDNDCVQVHSVAMHGKAWRQMQWQFSLKQRFFFEPQASGRNARFKMSCDGTKVVAIALVPVDLLCVKYAVLVTKGLTFQMIMTNQPV